MPRPITEQAEDLLTLFAGRHDVYGGDEGVAVREPVTLSLASGHLAGTTGFGIYPIVHRESSLYVRWGCSDIDTGIWSEAYLLWSALRGMGLRPYVERSRSKGWHIWIFSPEWVEARTMRRALKCAYSAIGLPAKEANPKQETLFPHQLGNYVRLPFKGAANGIQQRQVFVDGFDSRQDGDPVDFDWFMDSVEYTDPDTISYWAGKWFEPKRINVNAPELTISDEQAEELVTRNAPKLLNFYQNGPKSGDRSQGLVGFVRALNENHGYTPQEIWLITASADRKWGKFWERPNCEDYISDIVSRGLN